MAAEAKLEQAVRAWCKAHSVRCLKMAPVGYAGYPDDLFLYRGRACFIEFKAPGKKPRPLQEVRIAELRRDGFAVGVFDEFHKAIAFLESTLLSE